MSNHLYVDAGYWTPEGVESYTADTVFIIWGLSEIVIPLTALPVVGTNTVELDMDAFRLQLKDLEDTQEGMAFPATHRHNTEVVLSGTTYARVVEIINGYHVRFIFGTEEADPEHFVVRCVGANHNLADVLSVYHHHHISLIIGNAAGLIVKTDTVQLPPVWPSVVDANLVQINANATAALLMQIAASTMLIGTITQVTSAVQFRISFTGFTTEESASLLGRRVIFTSGNQAREAARITGYDGGGAGTDALITVAEMSSSPQVGDTVVIV